MGTFIRIGFDAIEAQVPAKPGLYEIYTQEGVPLKVGIGGNLRRRLLQHRESRQKYLLLRLGGSWSNPADVTSKRSILAKHLYFANPVTGFDLTTEQGRQQFLLKKCYLQFQVTSTREEARELEKVLEAEGRFQFVGRTEKASQSGGA